MHMRRLLQPDNAAVVVGALIEIATVLGFFSWLGGVTVGRDFTADEMLQLSGALIMLAGALRGRNERRKQRERLPGWNAIDPPPSEVDTEDTNPIDAA